MIDYLHCRQTSMKRPLDSFQHLTLPPMNSRLCYEMVFWLVFVESSAAQVVTIQVEPFQDLVDESRSMLEEVEE